MNTGLFNTGIIPSCSFTSVISLTHNLKDSVKKGKVFMRLRHALSFPIIGMIRPMKYVQLICLKENLITNLMSSLLKLSYLKFNIANNYR